MLIVKLTLKAAFNKYHKCKTLVVTSVFHVACFFLLSPCLNVAMSVFSEIEFRFANKHIYVDPEK